MTGGAAHLTVLLKEAIDALAIRAEGVYLDATFGRGGHSRRILACLNEKGRLVAVDRDPMAISFGRAINDPRFHLVHRAFGELADVAGDAGIKDIDGVLFDIGVSSPQFDDGERGFSFRHDAPLDMRMDTTRGETAAEWLARAEIREITEVIRSYGEERFAFQIAKKVVATRLEQPIVTTGQFAALVRATVRTREPGQDAATRSFQALRIHINQELSQLALALPQALDLLRPGGRLVVISFHSLEDRIVKNFMRTQSSADTLPKSLPLRADQLPKARLRLVGKAAKPSAAEIAANPRARSAVMRAAEKL
ncbi:MAG: 16S rRNA (cytosine(1402)-N(4))-methyltransferase RsmH [Dechloromonas sp.]|uniref:Ribosomal RNA small subunit methyltransferase H n=1 Tax=Candidatus Dechloromonas phosphorivorans TaxID=2899244 RepID=A0A9D7LSR3_9RHOO|nr:16S rRNA (cytosine(1402)-N(4))-methyltransferase RsmH [Candidatus Dechloromonas phosphorivorans]